jgi:hypothetical protein
MKYKTLFKHLVLKRFMIPLGIYRMERVSFAALDPSYNDNGNPSNGDDDGGGSRHLDKGGNLGEGSSHYSGKGD